MSLSEEYLEDGGKKLFWSNGNAYQATCCHISDGCNVQKQVPLLHF